jgi:hypothetical protein
VGNKFCEEFSLTDMMARFCNSLELFGIIRHPDRDKTHWLANKSAIPFSQEEFNRWVLNMTHKIKDKKVDLTVEISR